MFKFFKRLVLLTVGSLLIIGGGFFIFGSLLSTIGIWLKVMYVSLGAISLCLGVYFYYLGQAKDILVMIGDFIDLIISNF